HRRGAGHGRGRGRPAQRDRRHGRPRPRRHRLARAPPARRPGARGGGAGASVPGREGAVTTPLFEVLLATSNRGKLVELRALFADLPVELVPLSAALPGRPQAVEDGATFLDNARIKAHAASSAAMMVTIAEDAGLEVDVLGGRPGVRSARYAGEGATDAENN